MNNPYGEKNKMSSNKLKRIQKKDLIFGILSILIVANIIPCVSAWDVDNVNIDEYEGILSSNSFLSLEIEKENALDSWIFNIWANTSLKYYIVTESGKNYLDYNNASHVEDRDTIWSGSTQSASFKITPEKEIETAVWLVIKNENNASLEYRITQYSMLYSQTTLKIGLIASGISIAGIVLILFLVKKIKPNLLR